MAIIDEVILQAQTAAATQSLASLAMELQSQAAKFNI